MLPRRNKGKSPKAASGTPFDTRAIASNGSAHGSGKSPGFLPFATPAGEEARYLRQVVEQGGDAVKSYKTFSYELLQLEPGQAVLDVGCGIGTDLLPLAGLVGEDGQVTGLDNNAERLRAAKEIIVRHDNVRLIEGDAQHMPFPDRAFDRVRTDRVLLHISDLQQSLSEMWRVLKLDGVAVVCEPDWKSIAFFPGSPTAGDNDNTWSAIVQLCQRRLAHALIGRQLLSLFRQNDKQAWIGTQVHARAYILRSWQVVDSILQVAQLAQALTQEEPTRANEINSWLKRIEAAAQSGEFMACVTLYFAQARKGR